MSRAVSPPSIVSLEVHPTHLTRYIGGGVIFPASFDTALREREGRDMSKKLLMAIAMLVSSITGRAETLQPEGWWWGSGMGYDLTGSELAYAVKYVDGKHLQPQTPHDNINHAYVIGCNDVEVETIPRIVQYRWSRWDGTNCVGQVLKQYIVTNIVPFAFSHSPRLSHITIADTFEVIGSSAFADCKALTGVTIPNSVTRIGNSAFSGCTSLQSIVIPDSVTSIGSSAFSGCTSLKNVTLPKGMKSLKDSVFYGCNGLQDLTFLRDVTHIGNSTFSSCAGLKNVSIPEGVTYIGTNAFSSCKNLTRVVIPSTVTYIGTGNYNNGSYVSGTTARSTGVAVCWM